MTELARDAFAEAVTELDSSSNTVQKRLFQAWLAFHVVSRSSVPIDVVDEYDLVVSRMTAWQLDGYRDVVRSSLALMDTETVRRIEEAVRRISDALQRDFGRRRE